MRPRWLWGVAFGLALSAAPGCYGSGGTQGPATMVSMSFARSVSLYDAPFPSDDLRRNDGTIDVSAFPNPTASTSIASEALALVAADARGFGTSSGVFFALNAPLDPTRLPDMATSITHGSSVFLLNVAPPSPEFLKRTPLQITFAADGGPFGAPNLLSLVPLQGTPLLPSTTYAAVVLRALEDANGIPLGVPIAIRQLLAGQTPPGLSPAVAAEYVGALGAISNAGVDPQDVAGLAVFTTDAPIAPTGVVVEDILSRPYPPLDAPLMLTDVFPTYCVYQSTLGMPDYQSGTPPYASTGGTWVFDANGKPVLQTTQTSNLVVTVPRAPMPPEGFPTAVFIRTGGGGNRPLVDRGVQGVTNGPPLVPGTGPALYFAAAGFAGVSVDGPLGGLRNPTGDPSQEDYLIFNVFNGGALRDNIRESAVELVFFAHVLTALSFAANDCAGLVTPASSPNVRFDMTRAALMGHSMGATIEPLVLAYEPIYRAAILSGAGASWMANILYKLEPLDVLPDIELLLDYIQAHRTLTVGDPVLSLIQWAIEPADPLVYTSRIIQDPPTGQAPRQVLMEEGVVDHYILPPIANATSLSLGLDLAGPELDSSPPEPTGMTALSAVLPYSGRHNIGLPASGNVDSSGTRVTAVVAQHPSDGIEDGHEIVFQTDPPKHEYRCFLQTFLAGTPVVPSYGDAWAPCN